MPRKPKKIPSLYSHPTAGDLPLEPHPTLKGRVVARLNGVSIFETDAKNVAWPEPDPAPEPEQGEEDAQD